MDQDTAHMMAASKVLMLKPGEFEIWRMRIEQYIHIMDYALCDVIQNGLTFPKTQVVEDVETVMPITSVKDKAQRRLEVKARSTLMMGITNEQQLKFYSIKDANPLMKAIENRFGGNAATKKTQRNLLKQQYENFIASNSEILDQTFNRLQKLMVMLTIRARRFLKNTGRKLNLNGNETVSFDKTKVECFNCHKRCHFAKECRAPRAQDNRNRESTRRNVPIETTNSSALVSCDGLGEEFTSEPAVETLNAKTSEDVPKVVKKDNGALIIEDWKSDDEDESVPQPKIEKKTVKPSVAKIQVSDDLGPQKLLIFLPYVHGNPQMDLQEKGVIDSGCSRYMIGKMSYLTDYEEIDGGYVAFGGNPKGGKTTGKDDYSRFTWVFFLSTKDETSSIHKSFRTRIENLVDHKVKAIRCDNGTKFKNSDMNQFCKMKGIMRQYSVARTLQQNGVTKRRNKTLTEATRTMLADSKLPTTFWAEAVSTACYVQNRLLVVKPHNKSVTPPDGAWTEYVLGGMTLLSISSTKHKERPLRVRLKINTVANF
nr:putative ribonuclease H-like domain-containing protein [Tanacetum cinerariifolium]